MNFYPGTATIDAYYKLLKNKPLELFFILIAVVGNIGLSGCAGLTSATAKPGPTGPSIAAAPSSVAFGAVALQARRTQTVKVANLGNANLVISQAVTTGSNFAVSGVNMPVTVIPGQSVTFTVSFTPNAAGAATGSLSLASNAQPSPLAIPLSGAGLAANIQLSASTSSLGFGNVTVGSSGTETVTLTNTGTANVTVSQINLAGTAFSVTGLTLPVTLSPGQTAGFNVVFAPLGVGNQTGTVTVLSTAANSPTVISTSGTGLSSPSASISVVPSSITFGAVAIGTTNTQSVRVTNPGNANLVISQAAVTGASFGVTGLNVPLTVALGQAANFTVSFTPGVPGAAAGSVSLISNASPSPLTIPLGGTGLAATKHLSATPSSLDFSNISIGSSGTQIVTLTNTGNADVSVSRINITGPAFSISGLALPVTLSPGQTASFNVVFAPLSGGNQSSTITILSTASNSPAIVSATGLGVQPVAHSVRLSWDPSISTVVGYYIYRASQAGGPYIKLNSSSVVAIGFPDSTVQAGLTYFYVVTAVDSTNVESDFSNEVSATIPTP